MKTKTPSVPRKNMLPKKKGGPYFLQARKRVWTIDPRAPRLLTAGPEIKLKGGRNEKQEQKSLSSRTEKHAGQLTLGCPLYEEKDGKEKTERGMD